MRLPPPDPLLRINHSFELTARKPYPDLFAGQLRTNKIDYLSPFRIGKYSVSWLQ